MPDRKALTVERVDGLFKLVEVTIPGDGRKKVTYRDLCAPTSIEAVRGYFPAEIYRLFQKDR